MEQTILLTGGSGYVGGRLLQRLAVDGRNVRCLARNPERITALVPPGTELIRGDVLEYQSLQTALAGIDTAFYLIHSMGSDRDFEELDRIGAENFARAARQSGVKKIIYLGGLGETDRDLSPHLRSRHQVGSILASTGVPVIEFRASIVIGRGSLSFELVRALVERLPVMITPRWVSVPAQPIAINDLLEYLMQALAKQPHGHEVFEIGGTDRVTYRDLMREYARQRGIRRFMISVPVLTPRLSGLWLGLVTPVHARIGRKLVDSIRHPTVVHDTHALTAFTVKPNGVADAISETLRHEDRDFAKSDWWDSICPAGTPRKWCGVRLGNRIVDRRKTLVNADASSLFRAVQRIGGTNGYYFANWLWKVRGYMDLLVGGVGMRRRRRHPVDLRVGDVIDWWSVEALAPGTRLRLFAEMKLPGRGWLEFTVKATGDGSELTQSAIYDPVGLSGLAYWYGIYPVHKIVFRGMLKGIARDAERQSDDSPDAYPLIEGAREMTL